MSQKSKKIKVGISVGDINGVGLEVIIKTFREQKMNEICTPIVYGSAKVASFHRKALGISDFSFNKINKVEEANHKKANIIDCWKEDVEVSFGQENEIGGKYAFKSLESAANDLLENKIDALITAPINKNNIQSDKFNFAGHTEYLQNKFKSESLMLLVSSQLKVALVTNHLPINKVAEELTKEKIVSKLDILIQTLLTDFNIRKPKIAVLGLNPHSGDNGLIGDEEKNIIIPAIEEVQNRNAVVFGPYPADGFFGSGGYSKFDAVLAMYHDQGLIPFKSISFGSGVNYTAGLTIVRTSPDHGTAYDIAGKNKASEESFRNAVYLACDIVKNRRLNKEISANPLPKAKK